jgi:spore coat protein A
MVSRRDVLKLGALASGAALLPVGPLVALVRAGEPTTPPTVPFRLPLPLPPELTPVSTALSDNYDITMRPVLQQILQSGPPTPVWAYDGVFPGPTITAHTGRTVLVNQHNRLPVAATVHQHGQVTDGDSDGHPDDLIAPGESKEYGYPNRTTGVSSQMTARTMWYHDHAQDVTGRNVMMGLAGFYLLRDGTPADTFIPRQFEVPLVLQDRTINSNGTIFYPGPIESGNLGFQGDVVLVNGVIQPRFTVQRTKYRFRVLNGSNGRQYRLALSPAQKLIEIATEGGFIAEALPLDSLFIAQAERYEFVIDFTHAPDQVVLHNILDDADRPRLRDLLRFDVTGPALPSNPIPSPLRSITTLQAKDATVHRSFLFHKSNGEFQINGKTFDPNRIDAFPRAGTTEIWTVTNGGGGWTHPVHIHLINFQILDRDGRPPAPQEVGFKETVFLPGGGSARVIMQWPDVPPAAPGAPVPLPGPNPPGTFRNRYVFHCHNLEHEDHDMMGQFAVLPSV